MPDKPNLHDDPDAPPTEEERAKADELREALDGQGGPTDDAELARALRAAWSPPALAAGEHRRVLDRALARSDRTARRARVVRVAFGAGTVLALAASVAAVVWSERRAGQPSYAAAALATSRSTQPLFAEGFARLGGETSRIDRIVLARQADLRDNEFVRWGVR
jgi:hypothetical protein